MEPQEYDESMRQLARMLGKMPEPHYGMAELPQAVRALAKRYAALRAQLKRDMHRGQQPHGDNASRTPHGEEEETMALSISDVPRVTVDVYLMNERTRPSGDRHEYIDGLVYAMAGESEPHGTICMNLAAALVTQLRGGPCRAFSKDMRVRCGPHHPGTRAGFYAYPDLVVVCGERRYHDQERDVLLNPTVLIEVLSPSTEAFDRGEKFDRYRTWLATLTDYVLVAQDRPVIDHYHRAAAERWEVETLAGEGAHLHLASINCTVPLADVYERIVFPGTPEEE